jgi:phage shock protein A
LALKADMKKVAHTMVDLQTSLSTKNQELTNAKNSVADLKLRLATLEKDLEAGKEREKNLLLNWNNEKASPANVERRWTTTSLATMSTKPQVPS